MTRKVLIVVSILMFIGAATMYFVEKSEAESATRAQGTVIELDNVRGTYYPVVQFVLNNTDTIVFRSSVGSTPAVYNVGEIVPVRYNPEDPKDASVVGFLEQWLFTLLLITGAVVCLGISFLLGLQNKVPMPKSVSAAPSPEMLPQTTKRLTWMFIGGGILVVSVASYVAYNESVPDEGTTTTNGVVVDYSSGTRFYYPVVEFTSHTGAKHRFMARLGTANKRFEIGEEVKVTYNTNDPSIVDTSTTLDVWLLPLIVGGVGFVLIVIGVAFKLLSR